VDDEMVRALLKEYGSPAKVAASYRPAQYLIGPRLFPTFELVTKIVLAVMVGVSLAGLVFSVATHSSGPDFIQALGRFGLQLFGGLVSAFGNIVLVFAILERVVPASKWEAETSEEWDPAELEAEPDPLLVKPAEPVFAIFFTLLGLIVLNVYPNVVGINFIQDGRWVNIPALSEAFFRYLPWINLLGLLQIGLNAVLLRTGRWTAASRIADVVLELGGIALAIAMLAGPTLVNITAKKLAGTPLADASSTLVPLFSFLPALVILIIIVVSTIEVVKALYKMINRPPVFSPVK
jgi:hypothetical protein